MFGCLQGSNTGLVARAACARVHAETAAGHAWLAEGATGRVPLPRG